MSNDRGTISRRLLLLAFVLLAALFGWTATASAQLNFAPASRLRRRRRPLLGHLGRLQR